MKLLVWIILAYLFFRIITISKRTKKLRKTKVRLNPKTMPASNFQAYISKSTPTNCLLRDGKKYGEDYKDKIPPALCPGCNCELASLPRLSFKDFQSKDIHTSRKTDLGELSDNELKYYKYSILASRKDLDEEQAEYYRESLEKFKIEDSFKSKVLDILNTSASEGEP